MVTEADTRAELIDVKLAECGWKTGGDIKIRREFPIKAGRIVGVNQRNSRLLADYVLVYKNINIAVVEAKKSSNAYMAQAAAYGAAQNRNARGQERNGTKHADSMNSCWFVYARDRPWA